MGGIGAPTARAQLRAGGLDLRDRCRGPVVARRAGDHRARPRESEALAASLDANDGVYFVPALTGLGSPHWDPRARGTIVGLTRGSGRAHLARAALEAIAYQTVDAVRAMEAGARIEPLRELRADGGATANRWLMQFQADVLGVPVLLPEVSRDDGAGCRLLAGVGVGLWTVVTSATVGASARALSRAWARASAGRCLREWHDAVTRARACARNHGGRVNASNHADRASGLGGRQVTYAPGRQPMSENWRRCASRSTRTRGRRSTSTASTSARARANRTGRTS